MGGVDSSVAVGGGVELTLSSSLGGAGVSSVVELLVLMRDSEPLVRLICVQKSKMKVIMLF